MHTFYNFVSGPLAWIAFILFFGGSVYRIVSMLMLVAEKEKFIFTYMSWRYSLRSILHWIIPFATVNWRRQPVLTVVTFAFHICLVATPRVSCSLMSYSGTRHLVPQLVDTARRRWPMS
jgi:hypothetical protein